MSFVPPDSGILHTGLMQYGIALTKIPATVPVVADELKRLGYRLAVGSVSPSDTRETNSELPPYHLFAQRDELPHPPLPCVADGMIVEEKAETVIDDSEELPALSVIYLRPITTVVM